MGILFENIKMKVTKITSANMIIAKLQWRGGNL